MKADDIRTILTALNDAEVKYLIVGGLAVVAHGYGRFTQDIDLVIQLERANVLRALNAFTAMGIAHSFRLTPWSLPTTGSDNNGERKKV